MQSEGLQNFPRNSSYRSTFLGQFRRPSDCIFSRIPRKKVESWPSMRITIYAAVVLILLLCGTGGTAYREPVEPLIRRATCNSQGECGNGVCELDVQLTWDITENLCKCDVGWADHDGEPCSYEQLEKGPSLNAKLAGFFNPPPLDTCHVQNSRNPSSVFGTIHK